MGGVLTTDFFASMSAHCRRLGLPPDRFREVVTSDPTGRRLYHQIERGEITQTTFERAIAERLGVESRGLLRGFLADAQPNHAIINAADRARAAGIVTGWSRTRGGLNHTTLTRATNSPSGLTPWSSGEVGLRKPEPAIYELAAERLGLPSSACIYVDDIERNLPAGRTLGMATIHHVNNAETLNQLERLLGLPLRDGDGSEPPAASGLGPVSDG
jgi:putative hydrolase of the HAD superfamily